ncbi:MAG: hypothetical protein MUF47_00760 [Porphyrobacter sp.]|jgi:hypothetical protein|nr:hypothetical protein [Porphyrobacter sp.]
MITAQHPMAALAARLKRRAEVIGERRARELTREAHSAQWRDARALWPDFDADVDPNLAQD